MHPAVIAAYMDGATVGTVKASVDRELKERLGELGPEEAAVLVFLRQQLAQEAA